MMKKFIGIIVLVWGVHLMSINALAQNQPENEAKNTVQNVLSFTMQDIDGQDVPLADFKGQVLLIVNTASKCGYTPQYAGLEKLYEKYRDRGFAVLAFPANNFMNQEPGSNEEIKSFCLLKFNTTFPIFAKISVKGEDIHPLYHFLTTQTGFKGPIKWNFNKFLVAADGTVVARFDSGVDPLSAELITQVEYSLSAQE